MRKQLLAFLSALGLAGSSAPATAQVVKGSTPADTKSESTLKTSKLAQEDAASKDASKLKKAAKEGQSMANDADAKGKIKVSSVEGGHATSDAIADKHRKAGVEQKAADLESKHKRTTAEGSSLTTTSEYKKHKVSTENAASGGHIKKKLKNEAEAQAAQQDANKKANPTPPK